VGSIRRAPAGSWPARGEAARHRQLNASGRDRLGRRLSSSLPGPARSSPQAAAARFQHNCPAAFPLGATIAAFPDDLPLQVRDRPRWSRAKRSWRLRSGQSALELSRHRDRDYPGASGLSEPDQLQILIPKVSVSGTKPSTIVVWKRDQSAPLSSSGFHAAAGRPRWEGSGGDCLLGCRLLPGGGSFGLSATKGEHRVCIGVHRSQFTGHFGGLLRDHASAA
jgi:hypothetical protein